MRVQFQNPIRRAGRLAAVLMLTFCGCIFAAGQTESPAAPAKDAASQYLKRADDLFAAEKYDAAILFYRKALPLFIRSRRFAEAGACQFDIAAAQQNLKRYRAAIASYQRALPLLAKSNDAVDHAAALRNIGEIFNLLGDRKSANVYLLRSLSDFTALGNKQAEAELTFALAANYYELEDFVRSAEIYDRSLAAYRLLDDRRNIAAVLANLGLVYVRLEKQDVAAEHLTQALSVLEDINEPDVVARTLLVLGRAYLLSGRNAESLDVYKKALDKSREAADKYLEIDALSGIGSSEGELGNYEDAVKAHEQALQLATELKNESRSYIELGAIALAYQELGRYAISFDYNRRALEIARKLKDKVGEEIMVNNIGIGYLRLGSLEKAAEYIERAAELGRQRGDRRSIALETINLGAVYARLKQYDKAIKYFEASLPVAREFREYRFIVIGSYYYGTIRRERGEYDRAMALHTEAIEIARTARTPKFEARARVELGLDLLARSKPQDAAQQFQQGLIIARNVRARDEESAALDGLMQSYALGGEKDLGIFFGKQAVNLLQMTRGEINSVEKELQAAYVKDNEQTYRRLADLLVDQGRLPEAQQVLQMLKEQELSGFVRRDAKEIASLSKRSELRATERAALERYTVIADRVMMLATELSQLENKKRSLGESFTEQARLDELTAQVKDANTAFRVFLEKELAAELGSEKKKEVEADRALQGRLQQWGEGTVAISTIVGEDRYRIILTTPKVQVDGKTEIKAADLNRKIFAFRQTLLNPAADPRPLGKELYDILVKPVERDLAGANAQTLLWSLDGTLRYIPVNALWDGEQYLVEKYQNVIVTSTSRQALQLPPDPNWNILGGGVTKASEVTDPNTSQKIPFDELKGVAKELSSIVRSADGGKNVGTMLMDGAFTQNALEHELGPGGGGRKYNVVHFATHFRLGSDTSDSFLLLGNNQPLSLAEIADTPEIDLTDVELVTLSACNTGFGGVEGRAAQAEKNGKEIDSLAQFIEMRGAKAVMATLWPVVDESTALLMEEFYRSKREATTMSKAEALRHAQLALLRGEIRAEIAAKAAKGKRSDPISLDDTGTAVPRFTADPSKPFAHPHYWASFVLIGNWR